MSIHPDPNLNRLNVLGEPLASCCYSPITGYFRNGFCHTAPSDLGQHTICVEMISLPLYLKLTFQVYSLAIFGVSV